MQGYVSCKCFWDRLAKPHPHPASVSSPTPGVLVLDPRASEKVEADHEEWLYDACSHNFMQVAWEDLGDPDEKELLLKALSSARAQVPLIHGIETATQPPAPWSPEQVAAATRELEWLRTEMPPYPVHEVRDPATDELLAETTSDAVYVTTGEGTQLGLNSDGIWMTRRGQSVWTTKTLTQEELPDGTFKLTPAGGSTVVSSAAFTPYEAENPEKHRPTPRVVEHRTAQRRASTLERHLEPLEKLLKAARKTKHAIIWLA